MRIDAVPIGKNAPEDVNVIVEVPVGGEQVKYEMDKAAGVMYVDCFLYTPMRYSGNYGFVPHTLSDDGDPIDVIVCNQRPVVPDAILNYRPIGVLMMEDEHGMDEKVLAVPHPKLTKRYDRINSYEDLPDITIKQFEHFFEALQGCRSRQVGEGERLERRRRRQETDRGSHRAGQERKGLTNRNRLDVRSGRPV